MKKNIVAVVGRPNVGKSSLFNALSGKRISIVEDTPGVTRDRIYQDVEWGGRTFTLIDTGGIEPDTSDSIMRQMREQAEIAIETADVIVFMVDGRSGLMDADQQVADMLRRADKPVVLAVNKIDAYARDSINIYEFYELGLGDPIAVSAANRQGLGDLLEEVTGKFSDPEGFRNGEDDDHDDSISVAVIGKPNVGKSSMINKLIGDDRLLVSDIAGTTRDAVDTEVTHNGRRYIFIDTAGLRRKSKIKEQLERFMIIRSVGAIERADVAVILIDAEEGVTEQDARIAGIAHENGKAIIIAVNKWDLIEKDNKTVNEYTAKIRSVLSFIPYAEIVFISAKTGQRLNRLYDMIDTVSENHALRVQTGVLNEVLTQALAMQQPPSDKGRPLKVFYMTQVSVRPPTFVIFVNDKELMHFSYTRYIENKLREAFGFKGTPLRFIIRERKD